MKMSDWMFNLAANYYENHKNSKDLAHLDVYDKMVDLAIKYREQELNEMENEQ